MPDNIASLLERVRSAEGADRQINGDLWWRFDERTSGVVFSNGSMGLPRPQDHTAPMPGGLGRLAVVQAAPNYTGSIDAALALVERVRPGWFWSLGQSAWDAPAVAELCCEDPPGYSKEQAATPALAILTALLSSEEGEGNG